MSDSGANGDRGPLPAAAAPSPEIADRHLPSGGGGLLAVIERLAVNKDANMDVFARLMEERRREEDREAERAFNAALSNAKGELTPVLKSNQVDFTSKSGTRTKYKYEAFSDVAKVVDPVFARHGLSYRFSVAQTGKLVAVTCIVSHADGYSERTKLEADVDPGSTGMSNAQALGSILTYLQRYSLRAAIGLAAALDDDGRAAGGSSPKIDAAQANEIERMIETTGRSQVTLLKLVGADDIADLNQDQFKRVKEVLALAMTEKKVRNAPGN